MSPIYIYVSLVLIAAAYLHDIFSPPKSDPERAHASRRAAQRAREILSELNFPSVVYVLHVFQKKAKRGIATPRQEIDLVRSRYKLAQGHYRTIGQHEEDRHG